MSGGSLGYICFKLEDCADHIDDKEIRDLINDLAELLHDLEWYMSGDYGRDSYEETLSKFKDKWFGDTRNERLKKYLNDTFDEMKQEIEKLI